MKDKNQVEPAGWTTFWFGALILWLFFVAHIADYFRHKSENLLIFAAVPFMAAAATLSVCSVRDFWRHFPNIAPYRSRAQSSKLPVFVGLLLSLGTAVIWSKSPLFIWIFDSCKIIVLIIVSELIFNFIYNLGGRLSVMLTLLAGVLAAASAVLSLLVIGLLFGAGKDSWLVIEAFGSTGVPYAVSVVLYDCYRRALAGKRQGTAPDAISHARFEK